MRILHVTPFHETSAYGGMARSSAEMCRSLARRGHQVTVATALLERRAPLEEVQDGVRVLRFPGPGVALRFLTPFAPGLAPFLRKTLAEIDVAHVHGHRSGIAAQAARCLEVHGTPFVLQTHGTYPHHGQYRALKTAFDVVLGRRVLRHARLLLAVSEAEARDLPRAARVVPNGVTPLGRGPGGPRGSRPAVLFVGSDRPQKRGDLLPGVLERLSRVELHLVGRFGPYFLRLFRPFSGRVVVKGVLSGESLAEAYASAQAVVHPAVGEAFGLVPFEAALAGVPAVVAGGHGCGEWFSRAGGCVVPPDDVEALTRALRDRLDEPSMGREEARSVAAFASRHLSWDTVAAQVEGIYKDVLGGIP